MGADTKEENEMRIRIAIIILAAILLVANVFSYLQVRKIQKINEQINQMEERAKQIEQSLEEKMK